MSLEKKIYIICPVRKQTKEEDRLIRQYKHELELENCQVYYPPDNPHQDIDNIGLRILTEHKDAMSKSDECHIYYNPASTGSVFDLGMEFMAEKPLRLINYDQFIKQSSWTEGITAFVLKHAYNMRIEFDSSFYNKAESLRADIRRGEFVEFRWVGLTFDSIFSLGMAFMAEKPIFLANRQDIERTPEKSFQNVLLELDKQNIKKN